MAAGIAVREMPTASLNTPQRAWCKGVTRFPGLGLPVIALALSCTACSHSPMVLTAFRTEQQAQEHCPSDAVVWVDPQSGAYYLKGSASYGHAGTGRYACRSEAEGAGLQELAK